MVVTCFSSSLSPIFFFLEADSHFSNLHGSFAIPSYPSYSSLSKGLRRHQDAKLVGTKARGGAVRVLANPNGSSYPPPLGKAKVKKEVIMVDPLEAKSLMVIGLRFCICSFHQHRISHSKHEHCLCLLVVEFHFV
ncbi:unnamed protein product [Cochlearia groenlandica]